MCSRESTHPPLGGCSFVFPAVLARIDGSSKSACTITFEYPILRHLVAINNLFAPGQAYPVNMKSNVNRLHLLNSPWQVSHFSIPSPVLTSYYLHVLKILNAMQGHLSPFLLLVCALRLHL